MSSADEALVVHGWTVFAYPLFVAQLQALTDQVAALQAKDPQAYIRKNATKRLAAIRQLALEVIPQDPTRPEYRQGNTLGDAHRHWFRAKFFQQYRLFFRFHAASRIIVLAWVNDEDTRRAYESPYDAYPVFRKCWAADTRRSIGMNCWHKPSGLLKITQTNICQAYAKLTTPFHGGAPCLSMPSPPLKNQLFI